MTPEIRTPAPRELAVVQGSFLPLDDATLAVHLVRALAVGHPVSSGALADVAGREADAVATTLETWPNVERDRTGRVVGFCGLTLNPTPHRFTVGDRQLHTWCAWDTLFLPALLERPASVRSYCPVTDTEVELEVAPEGVKRAQPAQLFVSLPEMETADLKNITGSFCCHVHFLAGAKAGERWKQAHTGTRVVDVNTAYELGRQAVEPLLGASSGPPRRREDR